MLSRMARGVAGAAQGAAGAARRRAGHMAVPTQTHAQRFGGASLHAPDVLEPWPDHAKPIEEASHARRHAMRVACPHPSIHYTLDNHQLQVRAHKFPKRVADVPQPRRAPEQASTLPAGWYTSPLLPPLERRLVFGRSWQLVGHLGLAERPGQYFTGALAPWRFVVARGDDGRLRAFHNVRRCACVRLRVCLV
jgi:hypothetical protein